MVVATPPALTAAEFFKLHGSESNVGGVEFIRVGIEAAQDVDVVYVTGAGLLEPPPEPVRESAPPAGLWTDALGRMLDYLRIGVPVVVILDPKTESASVFRPGTRQETFEKNQTLTLPDVLPGSEVPVARFFEE